MTIIVILDTILMLCLILAKAVMPFNFSTAFYMVIYSTLIINLVILFLNRKPMTQIVLYVSRVIGVMVVVILSVSYNPGHKLKTLKDVAGFVDRYNSDGKRDLILYGSALRGFLIYHTGPMVYEYSYGITERVPGTETMSESILDFGEFLDRLYDSRDTLLIMDRNHRDILRLKSRDLLYENGKYGVFLVHAIPDDVSLQPACVD